jgi:hypothetical protein
MNKLLDILGGVADRGTEYLIAREERKNAALLPPENFQTPNEAVVQQAAPTPVVENGKLVGSQSQATANYQQYVKPALFAIGGAVVSAFIVKGVMAGLKGAVK